MHAMLQDQRACPLATVRAVTLPDVTVWQAASCFA